jgi:hypothetical protein
VAVRKKFFFHGLTSIKLIFNLSDSRKQAIFKSFCTTWLAKAAQELVIF